MPEHVQDKLPRASKPVSTKREQLVAALAAAKAHRNVILHNPLALKRQEDIIKFWQEQIAAYDQEWLA